MTYHNGANVKISIHAPPRGATPKGMSTRQRKDNFNSRPSARGDGALYGYNVFYQPFQFTPLREGRLFRLQRDYHGALISIHAPPRGATEYAIFTIGLIKFQFTPLREGRQDAR